MKFLTFDYKDSKGKETKRQVIQLSAPQPHYFCIDVAELEPIDMVELQNELEEAEAEAKGIRDKILAKYDVSKNYRYFKPESMTNLIEEE